MEIQGSDMRREVIKIPIKKRPANVLSRCKNKMKWKPEEDRLLCEIVAWRGASKWDKIAEYIQGRTGKQCRERWITTLSPQLIKSEWSREEDELLLQMHSKLGNQWATIVRLLPGRSAIAAKNRFKSLAKKRNLIQNSPKKCVLMCPCEALSPPQVIYEQEKQIDNSTTIDDWFYLPLDKRIRLFN